MNRLLNPRLVQGATAFMVADWVLSRLAAVALPFTLVFGVPGSQLGLGIASAGCYAAVALELGVFRAASRDDAVHHLPAQQAA